MPSGVYERTPDMKTGKSAQDWNVSGFKSKNQFYEKFKLVIQKKYKTPLRIVTVNLPYSLIKQMDDFKEILYGSRSEAVRLYVIQGVQRDLELLRLLNGDFEVNERMFPENCNQFTDRWGITWNIGRAIENV